MTALKDVADIFILGYQYIKVLLRWKNFPLPFLSMSLLSTQERRKKFNIKIIIHII